MIATREKTVMRNIPIEYGQWEYLRAGGNATAEIKQAIAAYIKEQKKQALQAAALAMVDDYSNDKELIAFTALDDEPIL